MRPISLDAILAAPSVINPVFQHSPLIAGSSFDQELGMEVLLKLETLNPIRSFKGRGADLYVSTRPACEPLICASAGNFGQGLAFAGRTRGHPVTVFAAETASKIKIDAMRALGAEVILEGQDFDTAKEAAQAYAGHQGLHCVVDGSAPEIAEGAGTLAVEILKQQPGLDVVYIPLGNGALAGGISQYFKAYSPNIKIFCVTAAGAPSMKLSLENHCCQSTQSVSTIADGIAVRTPISYALDNLGPFIDGVVEVDDDEIFQTMQACFVKLGLIIEPAGAVGLAAIMKDQRQWKGRKVCTILCGSNIDEPLLKRVISVGEKHA